MTTSTISVDVSVSGIDLDDQQQTIIDTYEETIETFLRKNQDYGNSFVRSAKMESLLKYGEIRSDEIPMLISKQIFVRGFLDKLNRFYELTDFSGDGSVQHVSEESVRDTLLDLGNYAIMLASMRDYYETDGQSNRTA